MSIQQKRAENRKAILEGRFITSVLERHSQDMERETGRDLAGFESSFWQNRDFSVSGNQLAYRHLKQHRFINMKTRTSHEGVVRKKAYRNHNQPLFGIANEIIKDLVVGFTDDVQAELMKLDGQEI